MNNEPQLDSLLKQMAASHRPELPSPDLIWWRAQILKKQERKEREQEKVCELRSAAEDFLCAACRRQIAARQKIRGAARSDDRGEPR